MSFRLCNTAADVVGHQSATINAQKVWKQEQIFI